MLLLPSISFAQGQGLGEGLGFRIEHESSNFLLISIITILLYIIMLIFKQTKILNTILYKKILNMGLLISFLLTTYSAFVSIFWREYKIELPELVDHKFWGIIMIYLSIFHTLERRWFFTNMFKFKKKEEPQIK